MITLGILQSVEFYVIAVLATAMIVAFIARPDSRGKARQYLLAGSLSFSGGEPSITLTANDDGTVTLTRRGLQGMTSTSAVSLAVTVIGFDITIEERLSGGFPDDPAIDTATFTLDFIAQERYHIRYNSDSAGLFAAAPFHKRPGYTTSRPLIH